MTGDPRRMTLDWHPRGNAPPEPGDVLRQAEDGRLWRIESIRPVTRGPNVGLRYYVTAVEVEPGEIPDDADVFKTRRAG